MVKGGEPTKIKGLIELALSCGTHLANHTNLSALITLLLGSGPSVQACHQWYLASKAHWQCF